MIKDNMTYSERVSYLYDGVLCFMYHMHAEQKIDDKINETVIKLESELMQLMHEELKVKEEEK